MTCKELKEKLPNTDKDVEVLFWDGKNANVYNVCGCSDRIETGVTVIFCDKVLK